VFVNSLRKITFKVSDLYFSILILCNKNVFLGKNCVVKGLPAIQVSKGACIKVGNNVTLNSRNYGYHANMHSSVKLMADRPDARIEIGANTRINGACIHAYKKIKIGENCLIAANVQIFDSNGHEASFDNVGERINTRDEGKEIIIENNVWIGINAIILPGVTIGNGSIIGANTVVSADVPARVVFAGNPGRVIKKYVNND